MKPTLIPLVFIAMLTACAVSPREGNSGNPTIAVSEIGHGETHLILSTESGFVYEAPDVCPSGISIIGWAWQIDRWPIQLLVSGSDLDGIRLLRVDSERGLFRDPDPSSISTRTWSVGGRAIEEVRGDFAGAEPRTPRFYTVWLEPKPGETVVDIEGGAEDYNGNDVYTIVLEIGTHDALCQRFGN